MPMGIRVNAGVGGCKSAVKDPCVNEVMPCEPCEASICEKITDRELIYDGFYHYKTDSHWFLDPLDANRKGLKVCDSMLLKKIKLIQGKTYRVDFFSKNHVLLQIYMLLQ